MTLHRTIFHTYEVISLCNVCLGIDNVAKAIGMGSIVIGIETNGIRNKICIMDVFHVLMLQSNLLLNEQASVDWIECTISPK